MQTDYMEAEKACRRQRTLARICINLSNEILPKIFIFNAILCVEDRVAGQTSDLIKHRIEYLNITCIVH